MSTFTCKCAPGERCRCFLTTPDQLREIIREELWRHDNPQRAYQRDLASQQAQLARPGADLRDRAAFAAAYHDSQGWKP